MEIRVENGLSYLRIKGVIKVIKFTLDFNEIEKIRQEKSLIKLKQLKH